jgi:hypothetical protein
MVAVSRPESRLLTTKKKLFPKTCLLMVVGISLIEFSFMPVLFFPSNVSEKIPAPLIAMPEQRENTHQVLNGTARPVEVGLHPLINAMYPFEEHCTQTYQSMMLARTLPAKFVLFCMRTGVGLGNCIRSLSGAVFVADLAD